MQVDKSDRTSFIGRLMGRNSREASQPSTVARLLGKVSSSMEKTTSETKSSVRLMLEKARNFFAGVGSTIQSLNRAAQERKTSMDGGIPSSPSKILTVKDLAIVVNQEREGPKALSPEALGILHQQYLPTADGQINPNMSLLIESTIQDIGKDARHVMKLKERDPELFQLMMNQALMHGPDIPESSDLSARSTFFKAAVLNDMDHGGTILSAMNTPAHKNRLKSCILFMGPSFLEEASSRPKLSGDLLITAQKTIFVSEGLKAVKEGKDPFAGLKGTQPDLLTRTIFEDLPFNSDPSSAEYKLTQKAIERDSVSGFNIFSGLAKTDQSREKFSKISVAFLSPSQAYPLYRSVFGEEGKAGDEFSNYLRDFALDRSENSKGLDFECLNSTIHSLTLLGMSANLTDDIIRMAVFRADEQIPSDEGTVGVFNTIRTQLFDYLDLHDGSKIKDMMVTANRFVQDVSKAGEERDFLGNLLTESEKQPDQIPAFLEFAKQKNYELALNADGTLAKDKIKERRDLLKESTVSDREKYQALRQLTLPNLEIISRTNPEQLPEYFAKQGLRPQVAAALAKAVEAPIHEIPL